MNHPIKLFAVGTPMALVERGITQHFQVCREADPEVRGIAVSGGHTRIDAAFIAPFPKLEIVSSFGVGYDHIDAAALAARGVVVTHTPDVLTGEVADLALGLLIATVRQLPQVDRCAAARSASSAWGASARPSPSAWRPASWRSSTTAASRSPRCATAITRRCSAWRRAATC